MANLNDLMNSSKPVITKTYNVSGESKSKKEYEYSKTLEVITGRVKEVYIGRDDDDKPAYVCFSVRLTSGDIDHFRDQSSVNAGSWIKIYVRNSSQAKKVEDRMAKTPGYYPDAVLTAYGLFAREKAEFERKNGEKSHNYIFMLRQAPEGMLSIDIKPEKITYSIA